MEALADGPPDNPEQGALWLMEAILSAHMITGYQEAVAQNIPAMAQQAAMTVAGQNGEPEYGRGPMNGVLWRLSTSSTSQQVGGDMRGWLVFDPNDGSSPPPTTGGQSPAMARNNVALEYLGGWNRQVLAFFDWVRKMSQYASLWRGFTCGQLQNLVAEYPDTNLPFTLLTDLQPGATLGDYEDFMDQNLTFVAVVSWKTMPESMPGLYSNPMTSDSMAYAEARVFVPTSRLVWRSFAPGPLTPPIPMGGAPGYQWPSSAPRVRLPE